MDNFTAAALLAGGKSSRMGFDKQLFHVGESPLFSGVLKTLKKQFEDVMVVSGNPEMFYGADVRVVSDIIPGLGPLSGIHAAISNAKSRYVYVIACDMPMIDLKYIEYMTQRLKDCPADACVAEMGDWIEPFHAFYGKEALPVIESDLREGKSSIHYLLKKINTLYIPQAEARRFTPDWSLFLNLNTPKDYEILLADNSAQNH